MLVPTLTDRANNSVLGRLAHMRRSPSTPLALLVPNACTRYHDEAIAACGAATAAWY
jgi:hypothetical protein